MSDGEVRGRLKVERNFQINRIKSFRIRKSPKEENLPFEREFTNKQTSENNFKSILFRTSTIKYCSDSGTLAKLVIFYEYNKKRKDSPEVYGTLKN